VRFWSWLFAAPEARPPLLGIFALLAEWRALMDPGTETAVAQIKLAWWHEEIQRLAAGTPVHPIGQYLRELPRAGSTDFAPLNAAVGAAAEQVMGAPLERGVHLDAHAHALLAEPLLIAAGLAGADTQDSDLRACVSALAAADYLARAIGGYRRDAAAGRVPFAVDELLAAGIENAELGAAEPSSRLQDYLLQLRGHAAGCYLVSLEAMRGRRRADARHLLVLAGIGLKQLNEQRPAQSEARVADAFAGWRIARRAAAGK
jgi:15-cis-phytoene synthase